MRKSQPAIITNACMAMMLELPVKTLVTLLSRTNTLLLNETEFAYLNERVGPVEEIVSRGCEMIVTKGARGGSFKLGRSPSWHDFEPVVVQQTKSLVGAGDTFAGAYVACRYVHRYDPPTAIAQASALASQCVASSQSAIM